jgi:hypothetical protein
MILTKFLISLLIKELDLLAIINEKLNSPKRARQHLTDKS